jgi:hypothetical protein
MQLFLEPTKNTPYVNMDAHKGIIEFRGVSSPENSLAFYEPVFETLDAYKNTNGTELEVNMAFVHFNTSSSKCLFDIFKQIKRISNSGREVTINWFYDEYDDDMKEVGEDYSEILDMEFMYHIMDEDE